MKISANSVEIKLFMKKTIIYIRLLMVSVELSMN